MAKRIWANMPARIERLPGDDRGYPVPYFVAWIDGKPDFRVADGHKLTECIKWRRCWICGERLGINLAFTIGPMCAINRISSEPPQHRDCAIFAAQACPFLTLPRAKRRDANLPDGVQDAAGIPIARNPGVTLVWITKDYSLFNDGTGGVLFRLGRPMETRWFAQGRKATRNEIMESIDSGMPILREFAERESAEAVAELDRSYETAMGWIHE